MKTVGKVVALLLTVPPPLEDAAAVAEAAGEAVSLPELRAVAEGAGVSVPQGVAALEGEGGARIVEGGVPMLVAEGEADAPRDCEGCVVAVSLPLRASEADTLGHSEPDKVPRPLVLPLGVPPPATPLLAEAPPVPVARPTVADTVAQPEGVVQPEGEDRVDADALPVDGALTDADPDRPAEGEALLDAEGVTLGLGLTGPEAVP